MSWVIMSFFWSSFLWKNALSVVVKRFPEKYKNIYLNNIKSHYLWACYGAMIRNVILLNFDIECMVTFYKKSILNKTYLYINKQFVQRRDLFCQINDLKKYIYLKWFNLIFFLFWLTSVCFGPVLAKHMKYCLLSWRLHRPHLTPPCPPHPLCTTSGVP